MKLEHDDDDQSVSVQVNARFHDPGDTTATLDELIKGLQMLRQHTKRGDLPICFATGSDDTRSIHFATVYSNPEGQGWDYEPTPPYVALS